MTGHLRFTLFLTVLCMLAFAQGCVAIYCTFKYRETPESVKPEFFMWDTEKHGPRTGQPKRDLAMVAADEPGRWILYDGDERDWYQDGFKTKQIVIDKHGRYIETLPNKIMRDTPGTISFSNNDDAYKAANVTVIYEEDTYPQLLEVEAWLRLTLGRLIAPFMGKSGRAFVYDSFSRFACGPPRIVVLKQSEDGSTSIHRFTLPHTEDDYPDVMYGTLISADGNYLYIYHYVSGAMINLNELDER